jgi:hypothetical protein
VRMSVWRFLLISFYCNSFKFTTKYRSKGDTVKSVKLQLEHINDCGTYIHTYMRGFNCGSKHEYITYHKFFSKSIIHASYSYFPGQFLRVNKIKKLSLNQIRRIQEL